MHQILRVVVQAENSVAAGNKAENVLENIVDNGRWGIEAYLRLEDTERYPDYTKTTVHRLDSTEGLEEVNRAYENTREYMLNNIERVRGKFEEMTDDEILQNAMVRHLAGRLDESSVSGRQLLLVHQEYMFIVEKRMYEKILDNTEGRWVANFDVSF